MFTFYKKHNSQLYNKLVKLSRNKFFYYNIHLDDKFETRILLIFFHLSLIFCVIKKEKEQKRTQEIFDNIFKNIEYHLRELGHGDVAVNKKMKNLTKIFYDILIHYDKNSVFFPGNKHDTKHQLIYHLNILKKYFYNNKTELDNNANKLADYFVKFHNFCFDLDVKNMLNGSLNFVYK